MAFSIDELPQATVSSNPLKLFINGQWHCAAKAQHFGVFDPRLESVIRHVADADADDAVYAITAADSAQLRWSQTSPIERSELLNLVNQKLLESKYAFADVINREMGKSVDEALAEVNYAAGFIKWYADEALRIHGRTQLSPSGSFYQLIDKRPVGPCLLITPWNFPLAMAARKVGPALAAGCTVIIKPSELTPLTALMFVKLLDAVGFPSGVVNILPTTKSEEVVDTLLHDSRLRKVSFTGSTRVGRIILTKSANLILRTSMELGGNAPFIVFRDADIEAAIDGALQAKLRNIGQACTAANRFYIQYDIVDEFVARLHKKFQGLSYDKQSGLGPMISNAARDALHSLVQSAVDEGASLICGGQIPAGKGCFYPPTILTNVSQNSKIINQEIFGPVVVIQSFVSESEVICSANRSEFGLASYIYTSCLDRVFRLRESMQVGMVGVNTGIISDPSAPFGGIKQSGYGSEGGVEGIDEYLTLQYTAINR